jgi:hypothetical protein
VVDFFVYIFDSSIEIGFLAVENGLLLKMKVAEI